LVDTLKEPGGEGILAEVGGNIDTGQAMAAVYRFLRQIGVPSTDYVAQLGDLPVGAMIISSLGACKLFHADLIRRAQVLLASLTGNLGRAGGGWQSGAMLG
jgi:nitrate reductase alpha subunit|tara:strand:- start:248 stop:550 length:303 start_codon:yes stop_codon:yes gene_type:complete